MLPNELYFVEYHVGLQLARRFGFRVNNSTPHASQPNTVYSYILEIIRVYDISRDELELGSVNKIYKRIIFKLNEHKSNTKYHRILSNVLPSYLQSFNYRLYNELIPVNTMFRQYCLDNDSCCYFCGIGPESIFHLFGTCEKLKNLWKIASETVLLVTGKFFDFEDVRKNMLLDLVHTNLGDKNSYFEKFLIYFNSIINYSIWKERNEIKFQIKKFSFANIVNKIIRSIRGRKNVDEKLLQNRRIPYLKDLCAIFVMVSRKYMPYDNG